MEDLIYKTGLNIREKLITSSPLRKPEETAKGLENILIEFSRECVLIKLQELINKYKNKADNFHAQAMKIHEKGKINKSGRYFDLYNEMVYILNDLKRLKPNNHHPNN